MIQKSHDSAFVSVKEAEAVFRDDSAILGLPSDAQQSILLGAQVRPVS